MSKLVVVFWLLTAAVELLLVAQPIGLMAQLALAAVIIVALAAISLLRLNSGIWRHVFLALASIMVLRYAYWRSTSTLPPMSDLAVVRARPDALHRRDVLHRDARHQPVRGGRSQAARTGPEVQAGERAGRRRLRAELQREQRHPRADAVRGQGDGLSGRQAQGLPARRRRHRPRNCNAADPARGGRSRRRRDVELKALCRAPRRQLSTRARTTSMPRPATSTTA